MKVFCYRPSSKETNFGDELSHLVVEKIINKRPDVLTSEGWPLINRYKKLTTVGSVIEWCNESDVIWGSGIRTFLWQGRKLDVRAVRGPITRLYLQSKNIYVPEIYGDPALLVPILFPEIPNVDNIPVCTVRHMHDLNSGTIKGTDDVFEVISKIKSSSFVESSSLHGLILADAYGIPSKWLPTPEPELKFIDYFLSTGRGYLRPGDNLPPPKLPDLLKLLKAFPYELFL